MKPSTVSLSLRLPRATKKQLDSRTKEEQRNTSEIVRDALKQYFAKEEFRSLRAQLVPKAQSKGIFTDDDVFNLVS